MNRQGALEAFYELLSELSRRVGGPRTLSACTGRDVWPEHGLYLFLEAGELRDDAVTPRVVRVGTHALTATSRTRLWDRLRAHRGTHSGRNAGGGNHRGSIFRLHVGTALLARDGWWPEAVETWGHGTSAPREVRENEVELERAVSVHIGAMQLLWVNVPDRYERAAIERGAIALLSNRTRVAVDGPSLEWLGRYADRDAVRESGLWNVNHVDDAPDAAWLAAFKHAVART